MVGAGYGGRWIWWAAGYGGRWIWWAAGYGGLLDIVGAGYGGLLDYCGLYGLLVVAKELYGHPGHFVPCEVLCGRWGVAVDAK